MYKKTIILLMILTIVVVLLIGCSASTASPTSNTKGTTQPVSTKEPATLVPTQTPAVTPTPTKKQKPDTTSSATPKK